MQEIKPTYVTFEQAKWLKEKGFDEICLGHYSSDGELQTLQDYLSLGADVEEMINKPFNGISYMKTMCKAPEQWQVVEWLRVKHGIWVFVDWSQNKWCSQILDIKEETLIKVCKDKDWKQRNSAVYLKTLLDYNTPQEAYSAAFDYVLNNNLICKNY